MTHAKMETARTITATGGKTEDQDDDRATAYQEEDAIDGEGSDMGSLLGQKCSRSVPQVVQKRSRSGPEVIQKCSTSTTTSAQTAAKQ